MKKVIRDFNCFYEVELGIIIRGRNVYGVFNILNIFFSFYGYDWVILVLG